MNDMNAPKISAAQTTALRFLAQENLSFSIDGKPAAQIKIRTARPLIAAGLVVTERTAEGIDADAAAGGWLICAITDAGRQAIA